MICSFLQKLTKTRKPNTSAEPGTEFKSPAVLPYVKGLSEQLRRCLQQRGVRAIFKRLVRPTDAGDPAKQDGVVYKIPCECDKVSSATLEDKCKTELRSMTETSDSPVPRPPRFQNMLTTPDATRFGMK